MTTDKESNGFVKFITDTHAWIGGLVGIATTALVVLAFGQSIIQAPAMAQQAVERIEDAESEIAELQDIQHAFRVAFCTKKDFLSPSGYAALECGDIDRRGMLRRQSPTSN